MVVFFKLHFFLIICLILCTNDFSFFLSFSAVTTDTGIDTRALGSSQNELSIIKLAFALTVPGMFLLCLGVNFLCYKWYSIRVFINSFTI